MATRHCDGADSFGPSGGRAGVGEHSIQLPSLAALATGTLCSEEDDTTYYGRGQWRPDRAYPFLAFVQNASQCWALYCLATFYRATHEMLAPMKPVPKFLAVKAIIFFTWWQGLGVQLLVHFHFIVADQDGVYSAAQVAEAAIVEPLRKSGV